MHINKENKDDVSTQRVYNLHCYSAWPWTKQWPFSQTLTGWYTETRLVSVYLLVHLDSFNPDWSYPSFNVLLELFSFLKKKIQFDFVLQVQIVKQIESDFLTEESSRKLDKWKICSHFLDFSPLYITWFSFNSKFPGTWKTYDPLLWLRPSWTISHTRCIVGKIFKIQCLLI